MIETRTVHFRVDPALRAYLAWIDAEAGRAFGLHDFDLFAAGYRARDAEAARTAPGARDEGED